MKKLVIVVLLINVTLVKGQEFNAREVDKLNSFGITSEQFDANDVEIQTDFNSILKLDKKRKRRKIGGIILASFGLLSASAGTYGLVQSKDDPIGSVISGFILASGVLEMGGSVIIFDSSHRKKRERNKIIQKYNALHGQTTN